MFVLLYKETLLETNDLDSSLPSIVSSLMTLVICHPRRQKRFKAKWRNLLVHVFLDPKKNGLWRIGIYFHTINNIMVKIRGRIISRKGRMMKIKAQRIRDA